ncbi:Thiol peroxidase, Bcp-type [Methanosarcina lacustris Z-7289]|uniref:thioredoxin-dependent peroxiredoxin n=1 Tax=Methanosarcina lacustris Z-7289 TaxID=1434111 RepID=A0A0E3WQK2_9EURY|nr:peroxiredoxin [Methanosarcina lacustris]AKB73760.1 Thiol peroxidase, Bcp-type [Methanosarcina lacustris Z-7289]
MVKTSLKSGQLAPDFCLSDQDGNRTCLEDLKGKWVVLYFYPRDNTPGCSLEARNFSCLKKDFEAENAVIIGISRDSEESHRKFIEKKELKIKLLSDEQADIHRMYDVLHPKHFRGKDVISAVRTTFLLNPEGQIVRIWDHVKAVGHAEDVLSELKKLKEK